MSARRKQVFRDGEKVSDTQRVKVTVGGVTKFVTPEKARAISKPGSVEFIEAQQKQAEIERLTQEEIKKAGFDVDRITKRQDSQREKVAKLIIAEQRAKGTKAKTIFKQRRIEEQAKLGTLEREKAVLVRFTTAAGKSVIQIQVEPKKISRVKEKKEEEFFKTPGGLISAEPRFIGLTPEGKPEIRLEKIPAFLGKRLKITEQPLERIGAGIGLLGIEFIKGAVKGPIVAPLIIKDIPLLGISIAKGEFFPEIGREIRERPQILGEIVGVAVTGGQTLKLISKFPKVFRRQRFETRLAVSESRLLKFTPKELELRLKAGGIETRQIRRFPKEIQTTFGEDIRVISAKEAARIRIFERIKSPLKRPQPPTRIAIIPTETGPPLLTLEKVGKFDISKFGKVPKQFTKIRLRLARLGEIEIRDIGIQKTLVKPKPKFGVFRKLPEPTKFVPTKAKPPKPFTGPTAETLDVGRLAQQQLIKEKIVFIEPITQTFPREQFAAIFGEQRAALISRPSIRLPVRGFIPVFSKDIIGEVGRISVEKREQERVVSPISRVSVQQSLVSDIERVSKTKQKPIQETFRDLVRESTIGRVTEQEIIIEAPVIPIVDVIPRLDIRRDIGRPEPLIEPPPPPTLPPTILIPPPFLRRKKPKKKKVQVQGFNTLIKRKLLKVGKERKSRGFARANKKPLTQAQAINLGARRVDNFSNRSFKIKKSRQKAKPSNARVNKRLLSKFRKKGNTFIEKTKFAIDSPGEKQQIPFEAARLRRLGVIPRKKKQPRTVRFF